MAEKYEHLRAAGTGFAGLPLTSGKWVQDRDRKGTLLGWFEMFTDDNGRWFTVPDAGRYIPLDDETAERMGLRG